MDRPATRFLPSLEGVRGYAFIIIFFVHYYAENPKPARLALYPWFLLMNVSWVLVPVFFALSGYLITDILRKSRERDGYFRVFYGRRALRILPLYYLVLVFVMVGFWFRHWHWNVRYLSYFVYLNNFSSGGSIFQLGSHIGLGHLWSLAVEEQFYLFWPLAVLLFPKRKDLLRFCFLIVVLCFGIRMMWPLFHVSMISAYYSTGTRIDGIICGAIVALLKEKGPLPRWFPTAAKWTIVASILVLCYRAVTYGNAMPWEYTNIVLMTPIGNLFAMAVLVLLLFEDTWLCQVCSQKWICHLGRMSYGLYILHFLYQAVFRVNLAPKLIPALGVLGAHTVSAILAFALTWVLAMLAYRFIEEPAMRARHYFHYGSPAPSAAGRNATSEDKLAQVFG